MNDFNELKNQSKVVGGYIPEYEGLYHDTTSSQVLLDKQYARFIPLISGFSRNHQVELTICDPVDRANSKKTYDENRTLSRLTESTIRAKYIDTTRSDLSVGSDKVILNMTDVVITVSTSNDIVKSYPPIKTDGFESYKGKIYILEVTSLNTPGFVSSYFDDTDYINTLIQKIQQRLNKDSKPHVLKALDIYNKAQELVLKVMGESGEYASNSIKVINICEIDGGYISRLFSGKDVLVTEYGYKFSLSSPSNTTPNPFSSSSFNFNEDALKVLTESGIKCYLSLKGDSIGERYMYIAGNVIKIPRIIDEMNEEGLYIRATGFEVSRTGEERTRIPIDEVDSLDFVFTNIEEALAGADRAATLERTFQLREQELRNSKIENESELLIRKREVEELKMELENNKNREEAERATRKAQFEEEKEQWELEREKLKADAAKSGYIHEREMNSVKFNQENVKTNNEAVLQTLKVVGGVVALVTLGYTVYKKLT